MADARPNPLAGELPEPGASPAGEAARSTRAPVIGAGAIVLLIIIVPLYREFFEPGVAAWNVLLGLFLVALAVAVFFLQRFFLRHAGEIGEARFDTRNEAERNG
jgi:hypothetical protein